jgi:hypothetical protein
VAVGLTATEGCLRRNALSGYACAEFSVCRCGSNTWYNHASLEKLIDPGLLQMILRANV